MELFPQRFMCMGVLPTRVFVHAVPVKARRKYRIPWNWGTDCWGPPCGFGNWSQVVWKSSHVLNHWINSQDPETHLILMQVLRIKLRSKSFCIPFFREWDKRIYIYRTDLYLYTFSLAPGFCLWATSWTHADLYYLVHFWFVLRWVLRAQADLELPWNPHPLASTF